MSTTSPFKVFSGTKSRYLAEKICQSLGCELGNMNITHFADGEFAVSLISVLFESIEKRAGKTKVALHKFLLILRSIYASKVEDEIAVSAKDIKFFYCIVNIVFIDYINN